MSPKITNAFVSAVIKKKNLAILLVLGIRAAQEIKMPVTFNNYMLIYISYGFPDLTISQLLTAGFIGKIWGRFCPYSCFAFDEVKKYISHTALFQAAYDFSI